jgi:hypothetical protein
MNPQPQAPRRMSCSGNLPDDQQTKAINKIEFLTESVRVYFSCHRPWGEGDEQTMVEVPLAAIPALPGLPQDHGHGEFRQVWEETVAIPELKAAVLFRFVAWQETDDCRMEALVGGPYLAGMASTTDRPAGIQLSAL